MKRFNFNNEDEENEDSYMPDYYGEEENGDRIFIDIDAELQLAKYEQNQKLLFKAIKMLEKSWFWYFRSEEYKQKKIVETFTMLKSLLDLYDHPEMFTEE